MAKNIFSTNYTLGILGGGQLGKMMLYTTRKFDIKTKVLDPSPDAPGQFGANEFTVGSLQDYIPSWLLLQIAIPYVSRLKQST